MKTHRGGIALHYEACTWVSGQFQVRQWNNYKVDAHHPNVYELVEVIKREESITTMQQLLAGASLAPRRRRLREEERR